jgi:hypothetical protein
VGEVVVEGAEGAIQEEVYRVIRTQPGRTTLERCCKKTSTRSLAQASFLTYVQCPPIRH